MTWEFETEPEFEEKLVWMREFVREEIYPLEVLDTGDESTFRRLIAERQQEVKKRGLGGAPAA